jgi:hypothetical protein
MYLLVSNKQKKPRRKLIFFVGTLKVNKEKEQDPDPTNPVPVRMR